MLAENRARHIFAIDSAADLLASVAGLALLHLCENDPSCLAKVSPYMGMRKGV